MSRLELGVLVIVLASACHSTPPTLDGAWANKDMGFPQKVLNSGETFEYFGQFRWDHWKGSRHVVATWSDGEGNRWFKTFDTVLENGCGVSAGHAFVCPIVGTKWQLLHKVNKSGKTLEFVFVEVDQFDEAKFPKDVQVGTEDLALAANYRLYNRNAR